MADVVTRILLEGGGGLQDVPASDVARFIEGFVKATSRAAGHVVGRPVKPTGRPENVVKFASAIRLLEVRSGSVEFIFAPAAPILEGDGFAFDTETISERAVALAASAADSDAANYPDIANVWIDTAEALGIGDRYEQIRILGPANHVIAKIDRLALNRLRGIVGRPEPETATYGVHGRLYEANFNARTAQLQGPTGEVVQVRYEEPQADEIYRVLRGQANLIGDVTYDPETKRAIRIRVRQVDRPRQLALEDFWGAKSLETLVAEQHLVRITDPAQLRAQDLRTEDWQELFKAIES